MNDDPQALKERFVGAGHGGVRVIDARGEMRYDDEDPYLLVSLALSPPPASEETWSVDDLYELRQEVRKRARDLGPDVRLSYVGGARPGEVADEPPGAAKGSVSSNGQA